MTKVLHPLLLLVVSLAALSPHAACVSEDALPQGTVVAELGECDETEWGCSSNSPEIDHYGFHELNLSGLAGPNSAVALNTVNGRAKLYKGTKVYDLMVRNSRIAGFLNGLPAIYGPSLVGAELHLHIGRQSDYVLRIEGVRTIVYPYPYGSTDTLEAYQFSWHTSILLPDGKRNVCKQPMTRTVIDDPTDPDPTPLDPELLNLYSGETLVFEGDRFDSATLQTSDAYDTSWFNLGCAGHTLAKMHLMRHTLASGAASRGVTRQDRQATLKLLSADYCGNGRPFTVAGVPLTWKGDFVGFRAVPVTLEARWTETGATCLNVPRLLSTQPDLLTRIATVCAAAGRPMPPACVNSFDYAGALRVSALP